MIYKLSHYNKNFQQLLQFKINYININYLQTSSQQNQKHYNIIIKIIYTKFTLITQFNFKI